MLNLQPTLANELVTIRPLTENDFDALYGVAKDPLVWEQHPSNNRHEFAVFKQFFAEGIASGGALYITDKLSGETIGSSRFNKLEGKENAIEIGWTFYARKFWGGMYNKAIKKLMIEHAFGAVDNVIFSVGHTNYRSQKAVEKIGGSRISADALPHLVKKGDHLTYLIQKKDWKY